MRLEDFTTIATGLDHPEGISVGPDGTLYAGGELGQVYRIEADGSFREVATASGFLFGVTLDGAGNVYGCNFGNGSVERITRSGVVSTLSTGTRERPMKVPNFAAFDDEGNLYVTDSGDWGADEGVVFKIGPGGETTVWTDALPRFPNGCCLTASGDALLVVESRGRAVMRVPIADDGSAGPPQVLADLTGSQPDGIALAEDGRMFVGCYRPDRIFEIAPDGAPTVWAEDPDGVVLNQPANVAFLDERLVVSSLGGWNIVSAPAGIRGLSLRYPIF